MKLHTPRLMVLAACVATLASCSGGAGPSTGNQVTFSVGTRGTPAAGTAALSVPITDAQGNTIEITSVKLVLREIEFKREEDATCDVPPPVPGAPPAVNGHHGDDGEDDGHDGHEDACESVSFGPKLVDLPLDAGVSPAFSVTLDPGTYDELKVKLHKPVPGDPLDDAFLAIPGNEGIDYSIIATGTYTPNGGAATPFEFRSGLSAKQEIHLNPPVVIDGTAMDYPVTLKVDVATWFVDGTGAVVDPGTAGAGGANEELVQHNIKSSFHAFRDGNHDCHNDNGSDND